MVDIDLVVDGWKLEGCKTCLTSGVEHRSVTFRGPGGEYHVLTMVYDFTLNRYTDNLTKVLPLVPATVSLAGAHMWTSLIKIDEKQDAKRVRAAMKRAEKMGGGWVYHMSDDGDRWVHYAKDPVTGQMVQDCPPPL